MWILIRKIDLPFSAKHAQNVVDRDKSKVFVIFDTN